ncbi:hypothetical protein [Paenibacillus sp. USDA918EY]|uniref:hypothetical protein n=1 Tax=Paenibacillus sp. USDA918EY TaxID=2689575 RepID=UPI00135719BD|nr:hypothetical protein [Paenibacillus sp. USDA918EY]
MPVQITINGENATQAIEEFATLSAAFSGQVVATPMVEEPKTRQRKSSATKKEDPEVKQQDEEEEGKDAGGSDLTEDGEIPSVVDLRAKAQEVGKSPEGKKAVKALLNKFNSPSISDVPEDTRVAFMAELEKLL